MKSTRRAKCGAVGAICEVLSMVYDVLWCDKISGVKHVMRTCLTLRAAKRYTDRFDADEFVIERRTKKKEGEVDGDE